MLINCPGDNVHYPHLTLSMSYFIDMDEIHTIVNLLPRPSPLLPQSPCSSSLLDEVTPLLDEVTPLLDEVTPLLYNVTPLLYNVTPFLKSCHMT